MDLTASIAPKITKRFDEVRELLNVIRSMESQPPASDGDQVRILRGLFYVHLYGAFEYSTLQIVFSSIQAFNDAQLAHSEVVDPLGVLVLDSCFKSIRDTGPAGHFGKRLDLILRRTSSEQAIIPDGVIDIQNVWLDTIEMLFDIFGIQKDAIYDITKSGYVRELVDTRNKVAHGRESPLTVGGLKRGEALEKVYEAIKSQTFYMLDCFSDYCLTKRFKTVA